MKRFSVFTAGFLLGALLFGAVMTEAMTGQKSVIAKYANIKVVVNSKLVPTKDEPFTMGGKTYVPLRVIGEALDQNVGWENNTVLVGSGEQSLLMVDLISPTETGVEWTRYDGKNMSVQGKSISKGFYIEGGYKRPTGSLKFFVQGLGIKKVSGSLALDDSNPEGVSPVEVQILQDQEVLWKGKLSLGNKPLPFNVAIPTTCDHVTFEVSGMEQTKVDFINVIAQY